MDTDRKQILRHWMMFPGNAVFRPQYPITSFRLVRMRRLYFQEGKSLYPCIQRVRHMLNMHYNV